MMPQADEMLDVLDEVGLPTGRTKARAAVHADGDWHRTFQLWVVREERLVLVQRRARGKAIEPGRLDVTVGGHFREGETLLDVVREAEEEIGLTVRPGQLTFLGLVKASRHYPDGDDREFQEVYAVRDDRPLDAYVLRCDEVDTLYEVPIEKLIALVRSGSYVAVAGYDCMQRVNNALLVEDDLVPQGRERNVRVLERLQAWIEGADPEAWSGTLLD